MCRRLVSHPHRIVVVFVGADQSHGIGFAFLKWSAPPGIVAKYSSLLRGVAMSIDDPAWWPPLILQK